MVKRYWLRSVGRGLFRNTVRENFDEMELTENSLPVVYYEGEIKRREKYIKCGTGHEVAETFSLRDTFKIKCHSYGGRSKSKFKQNGK
jgi:hypothetical protein